MGRPPGPHDETLARLIPVAQQILVEEGPAALTPSRIHHQSGVARATIYRNWPTPDAVVELLATGATAQLGSVGRTRRPPGPLHPMGPPRPLAAAQLRALVDDLLTALDDPVLQSLLAAGLERGRYNPAVATATRALMAALASPLRSTLESSLGPHRRRDDPRPDHLVVDLVGPLLLERVLTGRRPRPERVREVIERLL